MARIAAASVALASVTALAVAGVAERASVADSFTVLGHLHWLWIPAALLLESASMAAFAIMLRRLLAAGGASVGIRPMLATAYAANAVSVSVPLAGPALATAFTFRRFTRQGADAPLAWSLLAGGVISSAAAVLIVVLADPKDVVVPFETARRLTRALPDAHLQLVEGAGHNLPRRAPRSSPMRSWRSWPRPRSPTGPIAQPAVT